VAITASIALSSATAKSEQKVTATCTITNSGSGAVNVLSLNPTCTKHSGTSQDTSCALGIAPVGGGWAVSVPGSSGTLAIPFDVVAHSPITSYGVGAEPSSLVYDIGAVIYTSDGAITSATVATLTVTSPSA
jgi:hypothetical protein